MFASCFHAIYDDVCIRLLGVIDIAVHYATPFGMCSVHLDVPAGVKQEVDVVNTAAFEEIQARILTYFSTSLLRCVL